MMAPHTVEERRFAIAVCGEITLEVSDEPLWHDTSSKLGIHIGFHLGGCARSVPNAYLIIYGILCVGYAIGREYEISETS
jgi:hypothetical protein